MTTSFFPTVYEDEILYSVFARYHLRRGNIGPKATLADLFSSTHPTATVDLPSNIDSLIGNLPIMAKYTAEEFIYNHTLYPYYAPFLDKARAGQIYESMKSNQGGDIHTRAGIMASSISTPTFLRFCPQCFNEDLSALGEAYWHRIHQAPGVLVCPKHETLLQDSAAPCHRRNKHEYQAANSSICQANTVIGYSPGTLCNLIRLSKEIEWVLASKIPSPEDPNWHRERYAAALIDKGLASATGHVMMSELINSFLDFFGEEFLEAVQSKVSFSESNWLVCMVRKHRKCFHPVRHLLMMIFLYGSAISFFSQAHPYQPFGEPPWICLNKAADHYLKPVILKITISHCYDTQRPVGTFPCSCGFIYSRLGPDEKEEDKYRIGRIKCYGSVWEEKLRELFGLKLSLQGIAHLLNAHTMTVRKYAKLHGIHYNDCLSKAPVADHSCDENVLKEHKQIWLELQKYSLDKSKTGLRKEVPATYAFLYRHDSVWLSENSPKKRIICQHQSRINWDERDQKIHLKATQAVSDMAKTPESPRSLAYKIGSVALLEKHLNKLPKTKAYFESLFLK